MDAPEEIPANELEVGGKYLYQKGMSPRKEIAITKLTNTPGSNMVKINFKTSTSQQEIMIQDNTKLNPTHKFYVLPEEVPSSPELNESMTAEDPSGAARKKRRRTSKRKSRRSHKRRTSKK